MLIQSAYAQVTEAAADLDPAAPPMGAPSATEAFIWNIGLVLVLVLLFYVLLIRPQQKRFKEHAQMLSELKKGDKVVTTGGLVGKIDKVQDEEMVIDLGNGTKVTVLRNYIQASGDQIHQKPANDAGKDKKAK